MKYSVCLAVLIACTSGLTHAATSFPNVLNEGVHTQTFSATGPFFDENITFTLAQDSIVTGSFNAESGNILLLSVGVPLYTPQNDGVTSSDFGILEDSSTAAETTRYEFSGNSFSLGMLPGQTMGSGTYTFSFSGFKPAAVNSIGISLNVAPVPEPSTWAMLALGLVGVAGISASKRKRELMN